MFTNLHVHLCVSLHFSPVHTCIHASIFTHIIITFLAYTIMCGNADVSTLYSLILHRPAVCLPGPEKATVVVKFCPMLFELRDSIGEYIT